MGRVGGMLPIFIWGKFMGKVINAFHHSQVCSRSGVANCGSLPIFVNKVLLDHSQDRFVLYHLWLLVCYWSRVGVVMETIWLTKPNIFATWFFTKKVCWPLVSNMERNAASSLWTFRQRSKFTPGFLVFLLPVEIACTSPVFSLHSIGPRLVYLEPHPSVEMGDMKERVTTVCKNEKQCDHILRKAVYCTLW